MKVNRIDRLVQVGIVCALIVAYPGDAQAHGVSVPWLQAEALDAQGIYLALDGPIRIRKWAPLTFSITVLNARGKGDYVLKRLELIDPQGRIVRRYFGLQHPANEIIEDLNELLSPLGRGG